MNIENIIPQGARIVIKAYEAATESKAGLFMENSSNTTAAPVRGTIAGVGKESRYKIGQDVLFVRYSVYRLSIVTAEGEKEIMIAEDSDVLAVVESKVVTRKNNKK